MVTFLWLLSFENQKIFFLWLLSFLKIIKSLSEFFSRLNFICIFAVNMNKIVFLICYVNVLLVVLTSCEFKSDYKKDAMNTSFPRQGRIAIIKQRSGHVREYIVENDSSYFREAPDCPKCQEEAKFKFVQDSVKKSIRFKQFINKEQENEERRTGETVESEPDQTDTIRH